MPIAEKGSDRWTLEDSVILLTKAIRRDLTFCLYQSALFKTLIYLDTYCNMGNVETTVIGTLFNRRSERECGIMYNR